MVVSIVLLYFVTALTILAFIGMGVIAFLDWRAKYLWEKVKKEIDESIVFDKEEDIFDHNGIEK